MMLKEFFRNAQSCQCWHQRLVSVGDCKHELSKKTYCADRTGKGDQSNAFLSQQT